MNLEDISKRLEEIKQELTKLQTDLTTESEEGEEVNVDEVEEKTKQLLEEKRSLLAKKAEIETAKEKRGQLLEDIAEGKKGIVIKELENEKKGDENMNKTVEDIKLEALQSKAYESAFTKRYTVEKPAYTAEEQRALDTTNGAVLIPQHWLNEIYDQIREQHPILTDLTWNQINAIVHIPRRLAIVSGDAAVMEEGTCPVGEENEFDEVLVDLIEIQKMVELTAKAGQLLPEAFKTWLIAEVRDRIGAKMAEQAIAKIKEDVLAENKLTATTAGTLTEDDLYKLFATADGLGVAKVYANRKTLFTNIYPLKDETGQRAYVTNYQDPISGNLLGVEMKQESAMADGEILLVFPNEVFFNVPGGIRTKAEEDICFKLQIAGIAFMGLRLKYRKGAAILTIGEEAAGV